MTGYVAVGIWDSELKGNVISSLHIRFLTFKFNLHPHGMIGFVSVKFGWIWYSFQADGQMVAKMICPCEVRGVLESWLLHGSTFYGRVDIFPKMDQHVCWSLKDMNNHGKWTCFINNHIFSRLRKAKAEKAEPKDPAPADAADPWLCPECEQENAQILCNAYVNPIRVPSPWCQIPIWARKIERASTNPI
jgi:hypothetical protein